MSEMSDEKFPARVYKDTVLAPLFEGVKRHHWRYQMKINQASAVLLAECGLLTKEEAGRILGALDDILETIDLDHLVYTGEHEDFFFHVEAELTRRLGVEVAGKLHTGRSRNDIDHTVFKLALKDRLAALFAEHAAMIEVLLGVAERERGTIVVAYTHGQPAQPTTYGHYLAAFIELSLRDMDRLLHAARTVDLSSEIKKLHDKLRATVVYVTHDQVEAMTLADRIVILNNGIEQVGAPMEAHAAPTSFVAGFIAVRR